MALAISSAVAEELGEQLDVGRLAAAGAGAGELEQRLAGAGVPLTSQLAPWCGRLRAGRGRTRSWPRSASRSGGWAAMLMALCLGFGLVLGRADFDAQRAAGAVLGRHLDGVLHALATRCPWQSHGLEGRGSACQRRRARRPWRGWRRAGRPSRTCRTGCRSAASQIGDLQGDVALLPLGGAGRPGAVHGEGADGQQVALAGDHHGGAPAGRSPGASAGTDGRPHAVGGDGARAPSPRAGGPASRPRPRSSSGRPPRPSCRRSS